MTWVLTLIAAPGSQSLGPAEIATATDCLEATGARVSAPRWLAPEEACDIAFELAASESLETDLRARFDGQALDLAIQPAAGRRKLLLLADMDATIVAGESLDELAELAGLKPQIAAITARAMAGELDFAEALRTRVALLEGLPVEALEQTIARLTLNPGARLLVQTMKRHDAYTALISGGFSPFTSHVRKVCGFDEDRANRLLCADGKLTGKVAEPILGRDAKRAALETLLTRRGLTADQACTVGDGANDIDMLCAAGLGVAYHAKPAVREAAPQRIERGDLTALLYLQGYSLDDFAS